MTLLHQLNCYFLVPSPTVNVTALNNQTVGQSIALQCKAITVRGITSRVDIVWSIRNGTELKRMNDTTATAVDSSLMYTDVYNISQLNSTDEGTVIQCEIVINTIPSVTASNSITLDVTGEYVFYNAVAIYY